MKNLALKTLLLPALAGVLLLAGCARKEKKLDYSGDFASNTAVGDSILAADESKKESLDELGGTSTPEGGELLGDEKPAAKNGNGDLEVMNNDDASGLSAEEKIALNAGKEEAAKAENKKPASKATADKKAAKPIVKKVGEKKTAEKKTADAKRPADKKAVAAKKESAKKPADKGKVAAVKKPAAKKAEPKALAGSTTTIKEEKPLKEEKSFGVLELSRESYLSLPTFENELEDMSVDLTKLKPWSPNSAKQYAGTYTAQLGSEVGSVKIAPAAKTGQMNLAFTYSTEVIGKDGLIEQKTGTVSYTNVILKDTGMNWPRKNKLYVTQGQFVQWVGASGKTEYGFLTRGKGPGKPEFTLLRKVKA
jgi:outer membrane biosynthesis protein TonB